MLKGWKYDVPVAFQRITNKFRIISSCYPMVLWCVIFIWWLRTFSEYLGVSGFDSWLKFAPSFSSHVLGQSQSFLYTTFQFIIHNLPYIRLCEREGFSYSLNNQKWFKNSTWWKMFQLIIQIQLKCSNFA